MTSLLHKINDIAQIVFPKAMIDWLDQNVGPIHKSQPTLMDAEVPAEGDNWRIVKLYQRIGDGSYQYSIFVEFQTSTDFMHFKLVWA